MRWDIISRAVKFLFAGAANFYAEMVRDARRLEGMRYRVEHHRHGPAGAVEGFLLWVGARIASQTLRLLKNSLDLLEEASADVGEWVLHHR